MQSRIYTPLRILCAIVGVLVVANDTLHNVFNQMHQIGHFADPTVMSTIVIAIATMMGTYACVECFKSRSVSDFALGAIMFVAVLVGATFTFTQSIERVSTQRITYLSTLADTEAKRNVVHDENLKAANMIDVEIAKLNLPGKIEIECKKANTPYDPRVHNISTHPKCIEASTQMEQLRAMKDAYLAQVRKPKVELWQVDYTAQRLASVMPASQEAISLYLPWLLPLALILFGFTLFAWGMAGERVVMEYDLSLTGDAAKVDKAERYTRDYHTKYRRWPTTKDIMGMSGLSQARSDTIRRRVMISARTR